MIPRPGTGAPAPTPTELVWGPAMVLALLLTGAVAVLAAASGRAFTSRAVPALPEYGALPDFSLMDHERRPVSLGALAGSVWIADFIFTRCAGQCPIMSRRMAELQQAFAGVPGIRFISFTVDPSYDTPDILAAYARRVGVSDGRWRFVTGPPDTIAALARDGFRLAFGEGGTAEEPITHSVRLVLVDPQGRIRGSYDATEEDAMQRLRDDARRLLPPTP